MAFEAFETRDRMTGEEQLQGFFEQARRRGFAQQARERGDGRGGRRFDAEIELRGQAHRAQHADRIFAIPGFRIADQAQHARLHVFEPADVIAHREILDRVVQRVGGEVAAHRVVFDRTIDVVAQQATAFVRFAVAAAVVDVGAEGGDLDDLAPVHHVRQAEAASR
jgi:hypothetical protein